MIAEFIVIYILLLACAGSLYVSIKRHWWSLIIVECVLLFFFGNGFFDILGRLLSVN